LILERTLRHGAVVNTYVVLALDMDIEPAIGILVGLVVVDAVFLPVFMIAVLVGRAASDRACPASQ
jgi:hypothetical protein